MPRTEPLHRRSGTANSGVVLGVVGGSGGVGASAFAAVLAAMAGRCLLVDLDPIGGGVDVALGIEHVTGARWSGVQVAGGHLDPHVLLGGLPRWGEVAVLAADVDALDPAAVRQVLDAARLAGSVIIALPRQDCAERSVAAALCSVVAVLVRADVQGVAAAHAIVGTLAAPAVGAVVRRGALGSAEAAALVGIPLLGVLPALAASRAGFDPARPPRLVRRVAAGLVRGTAAPAAVAPLMQASA